MSPFAPGAGAPTVRGWVWFCCRSTAHGANRADTNFRPVQPPIRTRGGCSYGSGVGLVFVVGAPPRCELVRHKPRPLQVPIRTRGGCSYGSGVGLVFL